MSTYNSDSRSDALGRQRRGRKTAALTQDGFSTGAAERAVLPDEPLTEQILDGFGPASSGEDPFDAVVGLFE